MTKEHGQSDYALDNAGRLTGLTRYSNLAETTEVAATAYSYDHADRITGIVDSNSTGTTLITYGYTYDAADRVSQETRTWASGASSDTLTYTYTNNNQLTGVSHTNGSFSNESFTWDANGNETGTGYTTGTDNEQTASPGYTYTYDNAGEMTSETQTSTGDVWTYGYDFRGRMVTAVEKTSGGTTLESVTYTYDALDNRIGMDENGTQTWTLYDGGTPIMDFNGSGSLTMRYLWGPTGIVARQTSGGTVSWYLADQLGTVRDLINNSGGIIDHVDFSAFGTVLGETSPASGDRFTGFAMLERDTVTGLNLAVFREENPGTGRWDSQDPFGFGGGDSDPYRYVGNGAVNHTDPTGLLDDHFLPLDGDGQLMGRVSKKVDPSWGCTELAQALKDILTSIESRKGAMEYEDMFGEGRDGDHIKRKKLEQEYRDQIKKRIRDLECDGESGPPAPAPRPTAPLPTTPTTQNPVDSVPTPIPIPVTPLSPPGTTGTPTKTPVNRPIYKPHVPTAVPVTTTVPPSTGPTFMTFLMMVRPPGGLPGETLGPT